MWVPNAHLIRQGSPIAVAFVPPKQPYIAATAATIVATTNGVAIVVVTIIDAILVQFFLIVLKSSLNYKFYLLIYSS